MASAPAFGTAVLLRQEGVVEAPVSESRTHAGLPGCPRRRSRPAPSGFRRRARQITGLAIPSSCRCRKRREPRERPRSRSPGKGTSVVKEHAPSVGGKLRTGLDAWHDGGVPGSGRFPEVSRRRRTPRFERSLDRRLQCAYSRSQGTSCQVSPRSSNGFRLASGAVIAAFSPEIR